MSNFETNKYETEAHSEELDFIFNQESANIEDIQHNNADLFHLAKTYFRLARKKITIALREKMQKTFTNVIFLTLECPPFSNGSMREDSPIEYIEQMRKQYPDIDIRILIPIMGLNKENTENSKKLSIEIENQTLSLEKTSISFEFFLQNKLIRTTLYKFPKNKLNITIYGLYSSAFSYTKDIAEISKLQNLAPFIKSARICVRKLLSDNKEDFRPDIVHCENVPFFLGAEFENKLPYPVKVIQAIKDFIQINMANQEAFWAAINLADKRAMNKICKDSVVKKCVASLFKLHNTRRFYQMKDCLKFIYKNYSKFRKYIDKGEDIEENTIFNKLNSRILQLFPLIALEDKQYYNIMAYSIKRCDIWITTSKTYYKEIFTNSDLSGELFKLLINTHNKSGYTFYGINTDKYPTNGTRRIYQSFSNENFREERRKNKLALLKEFSSDRIKTGFIDPTLFNNTNCKVAGNLDSFYEAPLMFANISNEIFANGVDILFNTILKLFELNKNVQIVISMKDGMKINYVKSWVEFLSSNKYLNGRWVFIDGEISLPKFLAAADMILIPRRTNMTTVEHYLAMHYGCVPIASRSGILNDTIPDIFEDMSNGCGFKTKTGLLTETDNNELFLTTTMKALGVYQNNLASWNLLVKNCMNKDCSWNFEILEKYYRLYNSSLDS